MGSASPQIKAFISLAYDSNIRRSDKNLTLVQRQLQILSVVSDLSIYEPSCMETLEFYVCLEQLLSETDSKSPLAWKIINLYIHITRSPSIKAALRDEMHLMSVITNFFLSSSISSDKIQKTLQLLNDISNGIKLNRIEAWSLKLIPQLVFYINENDVSDEVKESALLTLANLCRGNHLIIAVLKESNERKILVKTLTKMKNSNIKVQLITSEMMIYLNLDHSKLENNQIFHTLDLLFMVVLEGLADEDEKILLLAKDIFQEIVSQSDMKEAVKMYGKFSTYCQNMLTHVTEKSNTDCVGVLFQFIALIVQLEFSEVTQNLDLFFQSVLPWLPNRQCGVGCLTLVESLLSVADENMLGAHIDELISSIKECINVTETNRFPLKDIEYLIVCLRLVESLIGRDVSFHLKLSKALCPPTLTNLMRPFLTLKDDVQNSSNLTFSLTQPISSPGSSSCNGRMSSGNSKRKRTSILDSYAEAVVRILSVIKLLSTIGPEFKVECMEMLSQPEVMKHIVLCERSADSVLVSKATSILSEDSVPNENINSLVEAHNEANKLVGDINLPDSYDQMSLTSQSDNVIFSITTGDRVDGLLGKLNGIVDKTEIKDVPLNDIMELYEYKLASMAHTEKNLQDALTASDAHNKNLRHSLLQSKVESERLRGMLRTWEQRLKDAHCQREKVEYQVDEIKSSARILRKNLVSEKTHLEREIDRISGDLNYARQEVQIQEKEVSKCQKILAETTAANKSLQKNVRDEQDKTQKLRETARKMEDESKRMRKEREDLEKENVRIEKLHQQSKKHNSELDLVIKSHEESVAEKEVKLEELSKTNAGLKKIQDMIHNMSAKGKPT